MDNLMDDLGFRAHVCAKSKQTVKWVLNTDRTPKCVLKPAKTIKDWCDGALWNRTHDKLVAKAKPSMVADLSGASDGNGDRKRKRE